MLFWFVAALLTQGASLAVRARQNAEVGTFVAAEEAEAGMAEMSERFREVGSELYVGAGGREHD